LTFFRTHPDRRIQGHEIAGSKRKQTFSTVSGQLETLAGLKFITIGTIAEMNDRGLPFKDVAAFIARNWEYL
jgi:hypothetical protein